MPTPYGYAVRHICPSGLEQTRTSAFPPPLRRHPPPPPQIVERAITVGSLFVPGLGQPV